MTVGWDPKSAAVCMTMATPGSRAFRPPSRLLLRFVRGDTAMMKTRKIEVFVAGCPLCEETLRRAWVGELI